jgi:hypothetical protein
MSNNAMVGPPKRRNHHPLVFSRKARPARPLKHRVNSNNSNRKRKENGQNERTDRIIRQLHVEPPDTCMRDRPRLQQMYSNTGNPNTRGESPKGSKHTLKPAQRQSFHRRHCISQCQWCQRKTEHRYDSNDYETPDSSSTHVEISNRHLPYTRNLWLEGSTHQENHQD